MKKTCLIGALLLTGGLFTVQGAETVPLWLRDVKISPDGKMIAFTYKGDIWTVPTGGGKATPLTQTSDYEATPIWSPDSKTIAFQSDKHGNFDIFTVPATGGAPVRLTFSSSSETPETFTPDGKNILFSAAIQDPASSALFPSARMTEVYSVPVTGGSPVQIMATPALSISYLPDGKGFLYQEVKGFEDTWRKHHTSSVTRDVICYDSKSGKHTNLTNRPGEDTNPVAGANGEFYYLAELPGKTMNVFKANLSDPTKATALTDFKTHPVRFLSRANDGMLAFGYDGEIYTLAEGSKAPKKVSITLTDSKVSDKVKMPVRGVRGAAPSPDGKSVAFVSRGDVYVTSVEYPTTKQITTTPETESDVTWSPDGKALYYTSERDGKYNIYKATIKRSDEEPDFVNATLIEEKPVFKADGHERTAPDMSPDGKKLAFVLDRNKLAMLDIASGKVTELTDGSNFPQRGGRFGFEWSPDSKWITFATVARKHEPYYDIAIINVNDKKIINLTNSGYFDEMPRWILDGNAIAFASERYGMRNHASWGSQYDVMAVFLNQDAYYKFRLSPEEYALQKDLEKAQAKKKEEAKKKDDGKKKDTGKKDEAKKDAKTKDIKVEEEGLEDRMVRLTPMSSDLTDAIVTADGETLYYIINVNGKTQLWSSDLRKGEHKMVSQLGSGGSFASDKDGKTLFLLGSSMNKMDPKTGKLTPISYSATTVLDPAKEREFMFDNMVREEAERFYTKDMHGVNWPMMTKAYRKFLPHIDNNYDFAELASELLGELNVSHTGGRYSHNGGTQADRTASLGLLYDLTYTGKGAKVDEVIVKGPFDRASSKVKAGDIIEKINNVPVSAENDMSVLLLDQAGKKNLISIYSPATGERWEEVVKPVSTAQINSLLYKRWVKQRRDDVDRLSNGRLGYVHIQSMADGSFREVYSDVLGRYNDREGIVIDIRWNGGGRLHEDIEVFFSGKKYLTQEVRGTETCDMPSRRWNKPSIMLMAEACYSNAHGTPWVYKTTGIGKLVGMPVPGTMTSVNWVTMQDPSLVYGIPVVGYRTVNGSVLENQQLEPDIKVANDPATIVKGEDLQLKKAVEELLKQIDAEKKK